MDIAGKKTFAKQFHSRQVLMKEIGEKGQERFSKSKVAVVGTEARNDSSLHLALAGVGHLV